MNERATLPRRAPAHVLACGAFLKNRAGRLDGEHFAWSALHGDLGEADACRALDYPIVSGNVSLYNESKATGGGSAILPTPAIGGVGLAGAGCG